MIKQKNRQQGLTQCTKNGVYFQIGQLPLRCHSLKLKFCVITRESSHAQMSCLLETLDQTKFQFGLNPAFSSHSTGAFGYLEVTHDITRYCKAKLFEHVGKKTPIAIRFSTVGKTYGAQLYLCATEGHSHLVRQKGKYLFIKF